MATDASEYADVMARIERFVGTITGAARYEIIDALDQNRDGVMALAEQIGTNEKLDVPVAVFIAAIRKGQHLERAKSGEKILVLAPREAFGGFFREYRDWLLDVADLDDNRATEWALDYAVSSMSIRQPRLEGKPVRLTAYEEAQTALTLEDELRAALGRPRPITTGEDGVRMRVEWMIIGLCLHDAGVAAMHNALMAQCRIPREPSHDEGRDARAAMIDEIRARNVTPAPPAGPLGDALTGALERVGGVVWRGGA